MLLEAARGGDTRAATVVLHYALGRPVSLVDLDRHAAREAVDAALEELGLGLLRVTP